MKQLLADDTAKQTRCYPDATRLGLVTNPSWGRFVEVLIAGLLCPSVFGAGLPMTGTGIPSLSAIDNLVSNFMATYKVPGGAVGFVRDGKLLFVRGYGYPILPKHEGGAMWFYSLPKHDQLCLPAEKIYADYLGAVKFGNIFSLDVGIDYAGRLRGIDVQTLRKVGQYIRGELKPPRPPVAPAKPAEACNLGKGSSGFAAAAASDGNPATRWGDPEVSAISDVEFFES